MTSVRPNGIRFRAPFVALACAFAVLLATPRSPAAETEAARAVVESLHTALSDVLENAATLGYPGRYERLDPVLQQGFDLPFMARKSVGRHWKDLDEAQRVRLLDVFTRLTVATYAARFDASDGVPGFSTLGVEAGSRETVLVKTRIDRTDDEPVQLNYRLRPVTDGSYRVIDVFLNGTISELALRRSEYSSVIKREGFDALLRALEDRITRYAAGERPDA